MLKSLARINAASASKDMEVSDYNAFKESKNSQLTSLNTILKSMHSSRHSLTLVCVIYSYNSFNVKHCTSQKRTSDLVKLNADLIVSFSLKFQGPDLVVHQPDSALNAMDEWCTKHHREVCSCYLLASCRGRSRIGLHQLYYY